MGEILYIGEDDGPTCQVCGEARAASQEVACVECGTLHHRDCWEYVGHCSIFGCSGRRWTEPHDGEVVVLRIDEDTPTPRLPAVSRPRGTNVPSARANTGADAPVSRQMWVQSKAVDLAGRRVRLDLDTPLENGLGLLAVLGAICAFVMADDFSMVPSLISGMVGLLFGFTWLNTDCTYILDNDSRTLQYRRKVLSYEDESPVARFDDIAVVTTRGSFHSSKNSSWWTYTTVAVLRNGAILDLTDALREDLSTADDNARAFAQHVGARYVPGQAERELRVDWTSDGPQVQHVPRKWFFGLLGG